MGSADPLVLELWKFFRGDIPSTEFEQWAYGRTDLESELGSDLYLATIGTDYASREAVWTLRCALARHARARSQGGCVCVRLKDVDVVDMGQFHAPAPAFEGDRSWSHEDVLGPWEEVAKRGPPRWWLWAARCGACGQGWLVGQEEEQNDVFCVKRIDAAELRAVVNDDRWPGAFDTYEALLRAGRDAGRSVRWVDPADSSLRATITELARARPGIAVTELSSLLNLDAATATELASTAAKLEGVDITFDAGD